MNKFKQIFNKDQEELLNMGLNFSLQQQRKPKKQIVIDIGAGTQFENNQLKEATHNNVANLLRTSNKPTLKELHTV